MDFHLFRIKVLRDPQFDAFRTDASAPEILARAIESRPDAQSPRGRTWSIANIERLDDSGVYFRFGRIATRVVPVRDENSGDFTEALLRAAPHTHVVIDLETEVCAIGHNTDLAPSPRATARRLKQVLGATPTAKEYGVRFHISEISRPDTFLQEIHSAYAITSFTVYFTPPNPFDIRDDFHRQMEQLAAEAGATIGRTVISGPALDTERLTALTRSAAATGDNVKARVREARGGRPRVQSLKGSTAQISNASAETENARHGLLTRIRTLYQKIRGDDSSGDAA